MAVLAGAPISWASCLQRASVEVQEKSPAGGLGVSPTRTPWNPPFAKGGLRGLRGLMHDIEAMLEGFALTCLAQGVLDSRFRGNDTMKRCSRMLPGV